MQRRYRMLFEEDREFNQGPFAEALRDQYVDERTEWLEDLQRAVHELLRGSAADNAALEDTALDMMPLAAADFRRAILAFDGCKPEKELERCGSCRRCQCAAVADEGALSRDGCISGTLRGDLPWRARASTAAYRRTACSPRRAAPP